MAFWAMAALLVTAAMAWACTDQAVIGTPGAGPNGGSALKPDWGPPGTRVLIEGREFRQKQVEIRWNSASGKLLATAQGPSFSEEFEVPERPPGDYTVVALQRDHNGDVDALARAPFKVTQGSNSPDGGGPGSASGSGSGGPAASTEAGRTSGSASGGSGAQQPEAGQTTVGASGSGGRDGDRQAGRTSESASGGQTAADPQPGGEIGGEPNQSTEEVGSRQPEPTTDDGRQGGQETAGERDHVSGEQSTGAQPDAGSVPAPDPQRQPDGQPAAQPGTAPTPAEQASDETPSESEAGQPSGGNAESSDPESGQDESSAAASGPDQQRERGQRTPSSQSATEDLWSGLAPSDSPGLPDGHTAPIQQGNPLGSGLMLGMALLGGGLVLLGGFSAATLRRRRAPADTKAG